MTTGVIATLPKFQFSSSTGVPLALGTLTVYLANTTTPTDTWQDSALSTLNTNPVQLDSSGSCVLWLDSTKSYKFILKNAAGAIQWTQDNITGNDGLLRRDLAASSGSSLVGYLPAGTGAVATTVQAKLRESVSVLDFGAVGDGVTDDTAAIQAALDTGRLVHVPTGIYKTTAALVIGVSDNGLKGEGSNEVYGSTIDYYGTDAAIKIFDSGPNKRVTGYRVEDLAIKVRTSGGDGIDFSHGSYGTFKNIWIRLLESNQSGVYGTGNTLGSSPYYNQFDNIKIFGNANNTTYPNQRGFYFVGDASGLGADGPNANIISNCGQIAGLSHGVHVESGVGNLFSNMIMESIAEYAYCFGKDTAAAFGRADENMVVNHWMEGTATCVLVRFEGDASANSLTNFSVNSIGPYLWDNQSSSPDNFVKAKGNLYVVSFYGEDIPANATTILKPTSPAWAGIGFGGVIPPFRCLPYVMQVTAQNFASGGLGTGLVRAYRTGSLIPALQFTVQDVGTARLGGKAIQRTPDVTASYNTFDGSINGQIEVTITTDAAWNQTSADVHVQVVFVS